MDDQLWRICLLSKNSVFQSKSEYAFVTTPNPNADLPDGVEVPTR